MAGIGFLHPAFLAGLATLVLPLLLHLLKRRKVRRLEFPTLRFFYLVQKRSSVLFRVGHLLLLLLRLLALAAVTILFAQPFFLDESLRIWNSGPRTLVLLWDDSGSTRARLPDGTPVAAVLRDRLPGFLASSDARDHLEVIALSPRARRVYSGPPRDLEVAALPAPGAGGADWAGGLEEAAEIFTRAGSADRVLLLASDFQAADFRPAGRMQLPSASVRWIRPEAPPAGNLGITSVEEEAARVPTGEPFGVRVETLRSGPPGSRPTSLQVVLHEGETTTVLSEAQLGDDPRSQHRFEVRLAERGPARLSVRLRGPSDALPEDDAVPLALEAVGPRRVLLVNGDPNPAPLYDELFYLKKAARAASLEFDEIVLAGKAGSIGPGSRTTGPDPGSRDFEHLDPGSFATVHMANVADPAPAAAFLRKVLAARGTVVLWVGAKVEPGRWQAEVPDLLAGATLHGRASHADPKAWRYANPPGVNPRLEGLKAAKFWMGLRSSGYWFLTTEPEFDPTGLLALHQDGTPAVHLARIDRGTRILVNAPPDIEDGDLPTHPIFPALVRRAARMGEGRLPTWQVGETIPLPVPESALAEELQVLTPEGRVVPVRPELSESGPRVLFRESGVPGIYILRRGTGPEETRESFQVRAAPEESRLEPVGEDELATLLPGASGLPPGRAGQGPLKIRELLALLLALVLLSEAFLVASLEGPSGAGGTPATS